MREQAQAQPLMPPGMMLVRMRCPACRFDYRFCVSENLPLPYLPEVAKEVMRCRCPGGIPKLGKNTPIEGTLMSINAVPLRELKKRAMVLAQSVN